MTSDTIQNNKDSILTEIQNRFIELDSTNQIILSTQEKISSKLESLNSTLNNSDEFQLLWIGAFIGAVLGLILSLIVTWIGREIKNNRFNKMYSKYSGTYLAYKKYDKNNSKEYRYFELKQHRNTLLIVNGISVIGSEDYVGMITLDENNFNHGKGYFQHKPNLEGEIGFGFLEIQLANNVILVHETIFNREGSQNSDAFRWIKQEDAKKEELAIKFREIQLKNSEKMSKRGKL